MKEWNAPEKEAQKMTHNGTVSVNLVTDETTYPSDRVPEQDYSASGSTAGAAGKAVNCVELHRKQAAAKKKRRKQCRIHREGEAVKAAVPPKRPSAVRSGRWSRKIPASSQATWENRF